MAALAALSVGGCKLVRTGRPTPAVPPAPGPPTKEPRVPVEEIEKIRAEIEKEARKEAERKAAEEIEKLRKEALEADLEALRELFDRVEAAVLEKDMAKVTLTLGQLRATFGAVCANSQVVAVRQAILRALYFLGANDPEGAKFHLGVALEASRGLKVDEVSMADKLGEATSALDEGKVSEAKETLDELEKTLSAHSIFPAVERLFEHFDGAAEAAGRRAWKVAEAEIEEASHLLDDFERAVKPPPEERKHQPPAPEQEKAPREEKPPALERGTKSLPSEPTFPEEGGAPGVT